MRALTRALALRWGAGARRVATTTLAPLASHPTTTTAAAAAAGAGAAAPDDPLKGAKSDWYYIRRGALVLLLIGVPWALATSLRDDAEARQLLDDWDARRAEAGRAAAAAAAAAGAPPPRPPLLLMPLLRDSLGLVIPRGEASLNEAPGAPAGAVNAPPQPQRDEYRLAQRPAPHGPVMIVVRLSRRRASGGGSGNGGGDGPAEPPLLLEVDASTRLPELAALATQAAAGLSENVAVAGISHVLLPGGDGLSQRDSLGWAPPVLECLRDPGSVARLSVRDARGAIETRASLRHRIEAQAAAVRAAHAALLQIEAAPAPLRSAAHEAGARHALDEAEAELLHLRRYLALTPDLALAHRPCAPWRLWSRTAPPTVAVADADEEDDEDDDLAAALPPPQLVLVPSRLEAQAARDRVALLLLPRPNPPPPGPPPTPEKTIQERVYEFFVGVPVPLVPGELPPVERTFEERVRAFLGFPVATPATPAAETAPPPPGPSLA